MSPVTLAQLAANISDYEFDTTKPLGFGACGTVYKATRKSTGEVVAIKFLKDTILPDQQKNFMRELGILAQNAHPTALRLLGYTLSAVPDRPEQGPTIITPLMPNGTINDMLKLERAKRQPPQWNATTKSKCIFGTAVGMAYVHSLNVLHRDLKPENVFLNDKWEPVIADFGISKNCSADMSRTMGSVGSPLFMAPEVFMDEPDGSTGPAYDLPADVYSFALFLYLIVSLEERPKFEGNKVPRTSQALMMRVGQGTRFERLTCFTEYYWGLITRCWQHAPTNRPTFAGLVAEFGQTHEYVLPGADMNEVKEYEESIAAGGQKEDDLFTESLRLILSGTLPTSGSGGGLTTSMSASMSGFTSSMAGSRAKRKFK
jgi:serine/threonine protein kinase